MQIIQIIRWSLHFSEFKIQNHEREMNKSKIFVKINKFNTEFH